MVAAFFLPFGAFKSFVESSEWMLNEFGEKEKDLAVICDRQFVSDCIIHDSLISDGENAENERKAICNRCLERTSEASYANLVNSVKISELLEHLDTETAVAYADSLTPENLSNSLFEGFPIGAYCASDIILNFKSYNLSDSLIFDRIKLRARSGALAFLAGNRVLTNHTIEALYVTHYQYGIVRSFLSPFLELGIPVFDFYLTNPGASKPMRFRVSSVSREGITPLHSQKVSRVAFSSPLSRREVTFVKSWLRDKLEATGHRVYSAPRSGLSSAEIRKQLGLRDDSKVVVALASSADEFVAQELSFRRPAPLPPYDPQDQFKFALSILELAKSNSEIDFVFRLHPRMFSEKLSSRSSEDGPKIAGALQGQVPNLTLSLPGVVGIFDLGMVANLVVNRSSTAGLEYLLLGIPVVGTEAPFHEGYPPWVNSGVINFSEADKLGDLLNLVWSENNVVRAARWLATNHLRTTLRQEIGFRSSTFFRRRSQKLAHLGGSNIIHEETGDGRASGQLIDTHSDLKVLRPFISFVKDSVLPAGPGTGAIQEIFSYYPK